MLWTSLFHAHSTGHYQLPSPFQPKRKNGDVRKKEDPHLEQEKVQKTGRKLKEGKLVKLN